MYAVKEAQPQQRIDSKQQILSKPVEGIGGDGCTCHCRRKASSPTNYLAVLLEEHESAVVLHTES